ncbi:uncharacterized protein BJX67DRAFT_102390 [Aspergillus lucknowensis]|uniref:Secreted protein n=1 Tax=Aspergillus lucknowensis TaxID=176173 RepID=A0ABR4M6J3_9EURO
MALRLVSAMPTTGLSLFYMFLSDHVLPQLHYIVNVETLERLSFSSIWIPSKAFRVLPLLLRTVKNSSVVHVRCFHDRDRAERKALLHARGAKTNNRGKDGCAFSRLQGSVPSRTCSGFWPPQTLRASLCHGFVDDLSFLASLYFIWRSACTWNKSASEDGRWSGKAASKSFSFDHRDMSRPI